MPQPTNLGVMLYLWRSINRVTLRQLAKTTGIGHPTLHRIERGYACDVDTWLTLQRWLFAPATTKGE